MKQKNKMTIRGFYIFKLTTIYVRVFKLRNANIEQWEAGMDVAFMKLIRTVGGGFRREKMAG